MLLHNLNPPKLCNSTRLTIIPYVLEAAIISGKFAWVNCFIFIIPMRLINLLFEFERLWFLVKLIFILKMNKYQRQSLKVVGLSLADPVFSHGQNYVDLSRVGNPDGLFIVSQKGKVKNIVYYEALNWTNEWKNKT